MYFSILLGNEDLAALSYGPSLGSYKASLVTRLCNNNQAQFSL